MSTTGSTQDFREIRACYDNDVVRVYQAYNDEIADLAVKANSFHAPLAAGKWSATRMTWIKPSAVWMAYRCGWSTLKDKNQARVLALDLSRPKFEELLMTARLSHGSPAEACGEGSVVVQWDPERVMHPQAERKQVLTRPLTNVRSIQIGLRGAAVSALMLATFLLRVSDVTPRFRSAAAALATGDVETASAALWPEGAQERLMQVPAALRSVLQMDAPSCTADEGASAGGSSASVARVPAVSGSVETAAASGTEAPLTAPQGEGRAHMIGVVGTSRGGLVDNQTAKECVTKALSCAVAQIQADQPVTIVSGGGLVPNIAFDWARKNGHKRLQVVCAAVQSRPKGAERLEIGTSYGDESERFIEMCQTFVRIGGGPQSHREVQWFKERHPEGVVVEAELPLKAEQTA